MTNPKPDFLCIGFHKCGTNWLYKVLSEHPEYHMPPVKEIDYLLEGRIVPPFSIAEIFSKSDTVHRFKKSQLIRLFTKRVPYNKTIQKYRFFLKLLAPRRDKRWYQSLFHSQKLTGDISPTYCFLRDTHIKEIASNFPHLKIIICLRDPVDRTWSHIKMNALLRKKNLTPELIHELKDELQKIYPSYTEVIDLWKSHFDKVHIIFQDDISIEPRKVLEEVHSFLGCNEESYLSPSAELRMFEGSKRPIPDDLKSELIKDFQDEVTVLSQRIPNSWPTKWLVKYQLSSNGIT